MSQNNKTQKELLEEIKTLKAEIKKLNKKTKQPQNTEIKLKWLFESMPQIVFAFDKNMKFTFVNSPDKKDLLLPPEQFIGKKFQDVMPAYLSDKFTVAFNKAKKGQRVDFEYEMELNGKTRWFVTKLSPIIENGTFSGVISLIEENTKQKLLKEKIIAANEELLSANQQLAANEKQLISINNKLEKAYKTITRDKALLHAIIESPHGMIIFALDKNYRYIAFTELHKQVMKSIWGVDIEIGKNMLDLIGYENDRKKAKQNFDKALKGELFVLVEEYGDEKLNRTYWENRYAPIFDEKRNIIGVSVFVIDITDRILTNRQLNALNQQLQAANQQLLATNQQLRANEQQLRALNQQLRANEQQLRATNQQLRANEQELRNEKEFSENLLETANSIIVVLDTNGNILLFNKHAEIITGYKKEEVIGKNWFELFTKKQEQNTHKVFAGILKQMKKFSTYNNTILCKDGSEKIIIWHNTVLKTDDNEITGVLSIGIDITLQKQTENKLRLLSAVIETTSQYVVITTLEGKVIYVNDAYLKMSGFTKDEVLGKSLFEFSTEEGVEKLQNEVIPSLITKGQWRGEMTVVDKYGNVFPADLITSLLKNDKGEPEYFVAVFNDISNRKKRELIQKVIYNITKAVFTTKDLTGFLQVIKEELGKIINTENFYIALYDKKTDTFTLPFHKDQKDRFETFPSGKTLTSYVIKTKKPLLAVKEVKRKLIEEGKIEIIGHDSKVWLGAPLMLNNEVIGVIAVQDYENENAFTETDMQVLEIVAHQISIALERKKYEDDLKNALDKAKESDRLKSAFLANMSHEIRTPMNSILGFTDLLQAPDYTNEQKKQFVDIIQINGKRMLNTINDIIDISKIETGQITLSFDSVNVNGIMEDIYKQLGMEAKQKGIDFDYKLALENNQAEIYTDETKLVSILTNLVKNAIKFTDKGSVFYGYHLINEDGDNYLKFYVKDTGIGIPETRKHAIFNPFEQADIEDFEARQGSGLGLSIAKAYTEMLNGKLWFESTVGKGSVFYFTVPYKVNKNKNTTSIPQPQPEKQPSKQKDKLKILIAEDTDTNAQLLAMFLSDYNPEILMAGNGKKAVEAARNNPDIDIILMDIKMPVLDGYEATKKIREFNKDVIIVAQTAYALAGDDLKALEAGCDFYISKPINKNKLINMINTAIGSKR